MSVPSTAAEGLEALGSFPPPAAPGGPKEALGGHRGLTKNSGGSGFNVSGILAGIMGLLQHISCAKAQQPYP